MNQNIVKELLKIEMKLLESEKTYKEQEFSEFSYQSLTDQLYTGYAVDKLFINEVDSNTDSLSTILHFKRNMNNSSYYTLFSKGCFVDLFYGNERRNFPITRFNPRNEPISGVLIDTDYISYFKVKLCNFYNYYDFRNGNFILKKSFNYEPYSVMLNSVR